MALMPHLLYKNSRPNMPRNVELKFKVRNFQVVRARLKALSTCKPCIINQEDIYFAVAGKRVKLRIMSPGQSELISYERTDTIGPRVSRYFRQPQDDAAVTKARLSERFGVRGIVRKRRAVYLIVNTRVHLDNVEGLGSFVELEVVLQRGWTIRKGMDIAKDLVNKLGLEDAQPVATAYIDLLEHSQQ